MEKSQFQFTNPFLRKLILQPNNKFSPKEDEAISVPTEFNVQIGKDDVNPTATVLLSFKMGRDSAVLPFLLEAEMVATFRWDTSLETDIVDALLSRNAPSLLLGYLRPIISNITLAAGLPAYNIPFMDFTK